MLETSIGLLNDVVDAARRAGTDLARVEIKSAIGGLPTKSLAPTISAFANTSGGVLILGLDERTRFNLAEGFDAKAISSQLADRLRPPGAPTQTRNRSCLRFRNAKSKSWISRVRNSWLRRSANSQHAISPAT